MLQLFLTLPAFYYISFSLFFGVKHLYELNSLTQSVTHYSIRGVTIFLFKMNLHLFFFLHCTYHCCVITQTFSIFISIWTNTIYFRFRQNQYHLLLKRGKLYLNCNFLFYIYSFFNQIN